MRLRHLFLVAASLLASVAHAAPVDTNPFDFTTTITGNGFTIVFPNVGGPSNYQYFSRVSELHAAPLYVFVNGGPKIQGELDFFLNSATSYLDLLVFVPLGPTQTLASIDLYGPDLIGFVDGFGFYAFPGTYNLTTQDGTPYTYTVTQADASSVPEPWSLTLSATAALGFLALYRPLSPSPRSIRAK